MSAGPYTGAVLPLSQDERRKLRADLENRFTGLPVPEGLFDPSAAGPDLLHHYGLPQRPDPQRQPLLRRAWDRMFGQPIILETFKLDMELVEGVQYRLLHRNVDVLSPSQVPTETSSNWSGAYITGNRHQRLAQIWGIWQTPKTLKPAPAPFPWQPGVDAVVANWIGLDGQRRYFDSSLPQIGTSSLLQPDGTVTVQAWTQWWARNQADAGPVPIQIAVQPGDYVGCILTAWGPQTAYGVIGNLNSKPFRFTVVVATAPQVPVPAGGTAQPSVFGATAEWIVERPRVVGLTKLKNLPDYGETGFEFCAAIEVETIEPFATLKGTSQNLTGARGIRMFDVLQNPARTRFVSMPVKMDDTALRVHYGGF